MTGATTVASASQRHTRLATRWGLGGGAGFFFAVLLDFGLDPFRTALRFGYASNFFDLQAQAFLHGRLDVPAGSLGIEGFVIGGRTYEYFPPFPALIRIPIMAITHEFDGRLTLLSMATAWVVFAIVSTKLLWLVRRCLRGDDPIGRAEAAACGLTLAVITGGTVLVFDAALPWAYHEVYLWSCALVLGSLYWLVRITVEPQLYMAAWIAGFDLAAVLTRTTGGFAVCGASIAVAVWSLLFRMRPGRRLLASLLALSGLVPLAVAITYNYVKFHDPYLFPLQDQVFTTLNARRREALARNGGTITGPQFLLTGMADYLRPDRIRFTGYFPYVSLPAHPAKAYGGAFLDQSYRTGSVPAFMPLLTLASLWSLVPLTARRAPPGVRALRIPMLAALAVPIGVLDYGYVAHRYTSEFVPLLVLGSMVGVVDVARRVRARPRRRTRIVLVALVAMLATLGLTANLATAWTAAQQTWGGAKLATYVRLQNALPGRPPVVRSATLPRRAPTDQLRIVGDCQALYLSSGDSYQPWLVVEQRRARARIIVGRLHSATLRLFTVRGITTTSVWADTSPSQGVRIRVVSPDHVARGRWISTASTTEVDVDLTARPELELVAINALPGGPVGIAPLTQFDSVFVSRTTTLTPALSSRAAQRNAGVRLALAYTPRPSLCLALARSQSVGPGS